MFDNEPVTYKLRNPITGTVRNGDNYASWTISEVAFDYCRNEKPQPPDWLVFKLHAELVDENGMEIPVEILSLLALESGLHAAFQREFGAAWDAVEAHE